MEAGRWWCTDAVLRNNGYGLAEVKTSVGVLPELLPALSGLPSNPKPFSPASFLLDRAKGECAGRAPPHEAPTRAFKEPRKAGREKRRLLKLPSPALGPPEPRARRTTS